MIFFKNIVNLATDEELNEVLDQVILQLINLYFDAQTASDRENIAGAIGNIAMSAAGRTALIENGAITTLNHLATQDNSELGQLCIKIAKNHLQPNLS